MNKIESQSNSNNEKKINWLEWILSIIAGLNCLIVVIAFAFINTSSFAEGLISQWPFPLLYFIEISALGVIGVVAVGILQQHVKSKWSAVLWICSGILLTFVILGSWTIGFFLIPAMVLYLVLGVIVDRRIGGDIPRHLVFFVAAGISQAVFVLMTLIGW